MKQFLLYLKHFSDYKRFNFLIPLVFSMISYFATAQTSGIYESYAILCINGGSDTFYDMQAATGNPDLNGNNLGSFVYGLGTLVVKGGENKTFKNSGCNINSSVILFRAYLTGSPSGSFLNVAEQFISNDGGGGNQTWRANSGVTNLIAGLSPGSYTLETYSQAGYDGCGTGTHYSSNGGANYTASFTVVKAESIVSVTGSAVFTYNTLEQGPNTSVVAGSTGTVTYSYEGASGTSYSVSSTPPTNVGSYTVIATVAADLNYNGASSLAAPFTIGASTPIPDVNFEQALIDKGLDSGPLDHYVLTSTISTVTTLEINNKNITSLIGIKDFTNLSILKCNNNAITNLDVSGLIKLNYMDCANNALTSLNISGLNNLLELVTNNNQLSSLDVSSSPNLYHLDCEKNQINSFNISGLTKLETLIVWVNKLTSLDVSNNPDLSYLDCDDNLFTSLDVSKLVNLNQFYCSLNQLTSLDVRGLTNLGSFYCSNNPLTCILVDDINAAIVASTKIDPDLGAPYTFWEKDATADYSYCDCDLTTTWDGTTWDQGAPTDGTYAAIIAGAYSVSANISACSLTIKNGATVTIPSGYNVTLNAPIIVEAGSSFTLNNNANLVQTNKNSINAGAVSIKRDSSPLFRLDYTMWSSPVSGTQTLGGFSPLTSTNRFYEYNTTTNLYNSVSAASTFGLAKGYLIRMPNTDPTSGYDAGAVSIAYPGVYTGVPNNGNVSLTGLSSSTYNAVGNPYPSTISADSFLGGNSTDGVLYFWRKTNAASGSAYATYTAGGATTTTPSSAAPNGTIQVGQGFIVKTGSSATTLNFTNAMRAGSLSTQFFKTKQVAQKDRLWLNLTNTAGVFSQMLLGYIIDATAGVDNYDGKYINDSPIALTSNINNEDYSIQGRPGFDASDIVGLNFKTNVAGDYTIALDHVDGLFSGNQEVFLLDHNTGTETNLKAGAYTFTAASAVDNARFSLKYQRTLGVNNSVFNDDSVTVNKNKGTIYLNSGAMVINNIKVFDIQGRLIAEQKNVNQNTATIKDLKPTKQVLIVKITSQDNQVVSKKVVN